MIDSGWNCTPSTTYSLCRSPMITPSLVSALTSRQSGSVSRLLLLLIHNFTMNYVHFLATLTGAPVVSSFYNLFLLLVFLTVVQIVFAQYVVSEREGEEHPLRRSFCAFLRPPFPCFSSALFTCWRYVSGCCCLSFRV